MKPLTVIGKQINIMMNLIKKVLVVTTALTVIGVTLTRRIL